MTNEELNRLEKEVDEAVANELSAYNAYCDVVRKTRAIQQQYDLAVKSRFPE